VRCNLIPSFIEVLRFFLRSPKRKIGMPEF
jgi:hypothetical protein